MHLEDLEGGYALVTGSTRGIGRATCDVLIEQGTTVFGLAVDEGEDATRDNFVAIRCDLSRPQAIRSAIDRVRAASDRLDYLVNVAGIDPKFSLAEGDEDNWDRVIDLNLRGYYLLIREALPLLRKGKGRSVVNVSSINYRLGIPRRSVYSVSKAGILGLTTGLARELGREGIRINSISPGWVFTERQVEEYFTRAEDREKHLAYLMDRQSIDRRITPRDIANHILFYLSEASAASTGHNCVVDGGWLLE